MRNHIFYTACIGFGLGVLVRSFLHINLYAIFVIGLGALVLLFFFAISKKSLSVLSSVFIIALLIGIVRFNLADRPAPRIFEARVGKDISLSGTILDVVQKQNDVEVTVQTRVGRESTNVLLFAKNGEEYHYGDEISFTGKLAKPASFVTDQGKEFDYVNYLKKDGIFYLVTYPKIDIVSHGGGNTVKRILITLRDKLANVISATVPQPESSVLNALILGERASFSDSLRQAFVNTGLIHVVTISGYHVSLVGRTLTDFLSFLPIVFAAGIGIFAIFLYVVMTGGAQTAIRAGIMATLTLVARTTGRAYDAGRALVLAGVVMVLVNPFILAFDVSFELSFIATVAVIFLAPKVERYFLWIKQRSLRDIVSITVAAYIFVLPFVLYKMGNWSLVALPANFAVLPFIPVTMGVGFVTGFVGLLLHNVAIIFGKIAYIFLHYELTVIGFFSHISFSSLSIPNFPLVLTILIYGIFSYYLFVPSREIAVSHTPDGRRKVEEKPRAHSTLLATGIVLTLVAAGIFAFRNYESKKIAKQNLQALFMNASEKIPSGGFETDERIKSGECILRGSLPDHECTPGAIFPDASVERICVRGYTQTVRSVSTNLRKEVFAEYGISYPQPTGAYEVDHLIPLALGGANDIANLFPEAAEPTPGFHEKDVVEVYLQQEVCSGRVALPAAQKQISTDWLAVYKNLSLEEISVIKKKYSGR